MRILITGGAGFLGSHLAEELLARGHTVDVLDLAEKIKLGKLAHLANDERLKIYPGDILDKDLLDKLIWQSAKIYHFAAVVGVEHYVFNPYKVLDVNVKGIFLILELALKYNKKVIFASTSEVYGKSTQIPFKEDGDRILGPTSIDRWCYSTSKALGEHLCFSMKHKGLRFVILRFFNAYGPRLDSMESGRVLSIFIGNCLKKEPIYIHGDGMQTRCFTYVSDTVEGIIKASEVQEAEGEIFNIGTNVETTILELAELTSKICGGKNSIISKHHHDEYGLSYEDIPRRVPCTEKANKILGFEAKYPLEEGLKATINSFKKEFETKNTSS